jgi:hypothetical protein
MTVQSKPSPEAMPQPPTQATWAVFFVTLAVYVAISMSTIRYLEPPTGDQPYYLMTTISLLEDGDVDEYNNYNTRASYDLFYPPPAWEESADFKGLKHLYPLRPDTHVGPVRNRPATEWYSKHGLGLSLLIAPGWWAGQQLTPWLAPLTTDGGGGWPGAVLVMNLLGALLAANVFLLAWQGSGKAGIAALVWAALAFSNPQMSYSLLIFPEMPAALLTLYAFRRLSLGESANGFWRWGLIGVCLGFLPWLHARFLPITLCLTLWGLYQLVRDAKRERLPRSRLVALLSPLAISGLLLAAYYYRLYGTILPNTQDHAGFFKIWLEHDRLALLLAPLGMLFDRQWGLLIYAPLFLLTLVGLAAMHYRPALRPLIWMLLLASAPYLEEVAFYRVWWGEWCPPARYLAVVTPLAALPLAAFLATARSRLLRGLWGAFALLGLLIMATMILGLTMRPEGQVPTFFNDPFMPPSLPLWLEQQLHISFEPFLLPLVPWFAVSTRPIPWSTLAIYLLISFAILFGCLWQMRQDARVWGESRLIRS